TLSSNRGFGGPGRKVEPDRALLARRGNTAVQRSAMADPRRDPEDAHQHSATPGIGRPGRPPRISRGAATGRILAQQARAKRSARDRRRPYVGTSPSRAGSGAPTALTVGRQPPAGAERLRSRQLGRAARRRYSSTPKQVFHARRPWNRYSP